MSSSGGRKRNSSGAASSAKRFASSAKAPVKASTARKRKYNALYSRPVTIPLNGLTGNPIPPRIFTKLKYVQTLQPINITAGAPTVRQYRLNSCYDPDFTGAGHQPYGFDQWSSGGFAFQNYMVHAVKICIMPDARIADTTMGIQRDVGIYLNQGGMATPSTLEQMLEAAAVWKRWYTVAISTTQGVDQPIDPKSCMINKFYRLKDILGRPLDYGTDGAAVSASPSHANLANIFAFSNNGTGTIYFTIRITYFVEFFNGMTINPS